MRLEGLEQEALEVGIFEKSKFREVLKISTRHISAQQRARVLPSEQRIACPIVLRLALETGTFIF